MAWCVYCIIQGHGPHGVGLGSLLSAGEESKCQCKTQGCTHGRGALMPQGEAGAT